LLYLLLKPYNDAHVNTAARFWPPKTGPHSNDVAARVGVVEAAVLAGGTVDDDL